MISIAICDDMEPLVEKLEKLIKQYGEENKEEIRVDKYTSGQIQRGL